MQIQYFVEGENVYIMVKVFHIFFISSLSPFKQIFFFLRGHLKKNKMLTTSKDPSNVLSHWHNYNLTQWEEFNAVYHKRHQPTYSY